MFNLIVTQPFGGHAIGDRISDPAEVAKHNDRPGVVRVIAPAPEPIKVMEPEKAPEPPKPAPPEAATIADKPAEPNQG